MRKVVNNNCRKRSFFLLFSIYCLACNISFAQSQPTVFKGIVKDSITNEPIPFVTVQFDNSTIGVFSDESGEFRISNRNDKTKVKVSFIGYKTQEFNIPSGKTTTAHVLLKPLGQELNEVIVRPKNEKYSKKNNPAVDLIRKVIENKKNNHIQSQKYFQYKEYERILFALNEFNPDLPQFRRYSFLPNYVDSSLIDNKPILPFSVREKISEVYFRNTPKTEKRIVKGYQIKGMDQAFDTEGLDAIIKETFKDISIFDNSITFLYHEFISPLSEGGAVDFYRWYISDTVSIDEKNYIKLDFAPFNSRDVGFTGNLYIATDSTYAVKRAILRAPKKMNINFVQELVIHHEFEKNPEGKWIPKEERTAIDVFMFSTVKFYIDKTRTYTDLVIDRPISPIYELDAPEVFEKDYLKRNKIFWAGNRPPDHQKDYRMDKMMEDINKVPFLKFLLDAGSIISTGYFPTSKNPEQNKVEIGTIPTFYSYNPTEGNRLRLTLATTRSFHPHLYLYGYGAYGTRDGRFKYYGEATWALRKTEKHKDEFPKNNLTVAYKYDMNNLGQRFTQAERDNILLSLRSSNNEKLTYNRQTQISYEKEYYSGFSFKLSGQTFDESPAGRLTFDLRNDLGEIYRINSIRTTEATLALRYAPREKFFQQGRRRQSIPSKKFVLSLAHTTSFKDVLGGQYDYNKTGFSVLKDFWIAPYGKFTVSAQAEKLWGQVPFPLLVTPSANNSFTIQKGNFYLIEPLEFVHDQQVSWEVYYHMGGWMFNRIPLLKLLKWREVFGFRGFFGDLSRRNNPQYNNNLLVFPNRTFTTSNGTPYMEYNIGVENILKLFRIDYVRRINYLHHPNINKDGFRITFDLTF